jgi:formamidopyrimidine-DNA glycosylase
MPELPEVETVRRIVGPQIVGRTIASVDIANPSIIAHPEPPLFIALATGQSIQNMDRRGKFLITELASGDRIINHLRMTGQLLVTPSDLPVEKHTHLTMQLSDGKQIRYIDQRRFGRFWYLEAGEPDAVTSMGKLGLEPMDGALTGGYLKTKLGKRGTSIKEALLDQTVVAGIGNIYADEILFTAHIHPETKCRALSTRAWNKLASTIGEVIVWGIDTNRMTPGEYLAGKGREYRNTPDLKAYGRAGEPCLRCGRPMRRISVGGRSSCFCPYCQRKRA